MTTMKSSMGHSAPLSVGRIRAGGRSGAVFLISRYGHLLTCWHTLTPKEASVPTPGPYGIEFLRHPGLPSFQTNATLLTEYVAADLDVAVLRCESSIPDYLHPIPLGHAPRPNASFHATGFPLVSESQSHNVTMDGTFTNPFCSHPDGKDIWAAQLYGTQVAGGLHPPGYSGAPCIVEGAAVAMIRTFLPHRGQLLEATERIVDAYGGSEPVVLHGKVQQAGAQGGILWATLIWQIAERFPQLFHWDGTLWSVSEKPVAPPPFDAPVGVVHVGSEPGTWGLLLGRSGYLLTSRQPFLNAQVKSALPLQLRYELGERILPAELVSGDFSVPFALLRLACGEEALSSLPPLELGRLEEERYLQYPIPVEIYGLGATCDGAPLAWQAEHGSLLHDWEGNPLGVSRSTRLRTGLISVDGVVVATIPEPPTAKLQSGYSLRVLLQDLKPDCLGELLPLHAGYSSGLIFTLASMLEKLSDVSLDVLHNVEAILGLSPLQLSKVRRCARLAVTLTKIRTRQPELRDALSALCRLLPKEDRTLLATQLRSTEVPEVTAARLRAACNRQPRVPIVLRCDDTDSYTGISLLTRAVPRRNYLLAEISEKVAGRDLQSIRSNLIEVFYRDAEFDLHVENDCDVEYIETEVKGLLAKQTGIVLVRINSALRPDILFTLQAEFPTVLFIAVCAKNALPQGAAMLAGFVLIDVPSLVPTVPIQNTSSAPGLTQAGLRTHAAS